MRHLGPLDAHTIGELRVTRIPRTFADLAHVIPWAAFRAPADAGRRPDVGAVAAARRRVR